MAFGFLQPKSDREPGWAGWVFWIPDEEDFYMFEPVSA